MSGVLDSVDQRTNLVGRNRLELLLFRLTGRQLFAINVFKVQEVLKLPRLTAIPQRHTAIEGVVHFRGESVPVINLPAAIGMRPLQIDENTTMVVTEYNRTRQAFLIDGVERIVNMNWEEVQSPPRTAGRGHYLTAITRYDDQLVEIIDVEKVLAEIVTYSTDLPDDLVDPELVGRAGRRKVLLVDDSPVALRQSRETLAKMGLETIEAANGREGLVRLQELADTDEDIRDEVLMVITDAEMPEMDGYRLTTEIREDPRLRSLHVVLHTSLSGSFNRSMVQRVGCDGFLSKFRPEELAVLVQDYLSDNLPA